MAQDFKVSGLIEILTRIKGGELSKKEFDGIQKRARELGFTLKSDTTPQIKKLRQEARSAGLELQKLGDGGRRAGLGIGALGKQLVAFVGVAAVIRTITAGVQAFAEFERRLSAIAQQLDRLGLATQSTIPKLREFLTIQEGLGVNIDDAAASFQKFVGITKSVEGAMAAVRLSTDLTNARLGDMRTNTERLANLLQGEVTEAAKALGLQLRKESGEVKTQVELLDELIAQYVGFSETQTDSQSKLETFSAQWARFTRLLGGAFAPVLGIVNKALEVTASGFKAFTAQLAIASTTANELIGKFAGLFGVRPSDIAATVEAVKKQNDALDDRNKNAITKDKELTSALEVLRELADRRQKERDRKALESELAEREKAERELAERRVQFEESVQQRILQERVRLAEKGSQAQLDAEREVLANLRRLALEEAERLGADANLIKEQFRLADEVLEQEFRDKREEDERKLAEERADFILNAQRELLEARIDLEDEYSQERLDLERQALEEAAEQEIALAEKTGASVAAVRRKWDLVIAKFEKDSAKARTEIAETEKQAKIQTALDIASATVAFGRAVFGESKAVAIAEAIVATARAVAQALPNIPLAALVAATGAAQIAKIKSTNIGSGGAGIGGVGGAAGALAVEGGAQRTTGGPFPITQQQTVDQRSTQGDTINFNFTGVNVVDRSSLRKFKRQLVRVDRGRAL